MNKNVLKKIGVGVGMAGLALFPFLALAQYGGVNEAIITKPGDISTLVTNIMGWFAGIVLTIAVAMLLYAAILYLTAGSSEVIHTKAKSVLLYAIVGIVVAILAFSVVPFIRNVLGGRFY